MLGYGLIWPYKALNGVLWPYKGAIWRYKAFMALYGFIKAFYGVIWPYKGLYGVIRRYMVSMMHCHWEIAEQQAGEVFLT